MKRFSTRSLLLLAGWSLLGPGVGFAAPPVPASAVGDRVDAAVAAGASFLVTQQQGSGAIADAGLGARYQTALTGLGVLALTSAGHSPADKTAEGVALRRAIYFLLRADRQGRDGFFGQADSSTLHGHGVVTLTLFELLNLQLDPEQEQLIRTKAIAAAQYIVQAQSAPKMDARDIGGWRYRGNSTDSDLSVTIWQLLALRSAQKAGGVVLPATARAAERFLITTFWRNDWFFAYEPFPPPMLPLITNPPPATAAAPPIAPSVPVSGPPVAAKGGPMK